MSPIMTKLLIRLNSAKKITTSPAVLKNTPDCSLSLIAKELKLRSAKTGRVPSANTNMTIAPVKKLPVERA